jgi:hypothetical protein
VRDLCRQAFDQLYSPDFGLVPEERLRRGLPLVLTAFETTRLDDLDRLDRIVHDLLETSFAPFSSSQIHPTRLNRLAIILLAALEKCVHFIPFGS